jgi:hypothetical protein
MTAARANVVSSFTVIKGTQLDATYEAFQRWDLDSTKKQNLDRLKATDPLGVGSANWWRDLAKTINRRFDTDGRDSILVELAQAQCPMHTWKPLVLWHMTRDEFLVRDFLSGWLFDQHESGAWRLRATDVEPYLASLHRREDVEIKDKWSTSTTKRVASGLLRLAVDFDLMRGTIAREFVSYHLPDEAFLYLLHAARELQPNAHRLISLADWRMYRLDAASVQQELFRLHQYHRLHYEVAGTIGELRLPHESAVAYARAELMA